MSKTDNSNSEEKLREKLRAVYEAERIAIEKSPEYKDLLAKVMANNERLVEQRRSAPASQAQVRSNLPNLTLVVLKPVSANDAYFKMASGAFADKKIDDLDSAHQPQWQGKAAYEGDTIELLADRGVGSNAVVHVTAIVDNPQVLRAGMSLSLRHPGLSEEKCRCRGVLERVGSTRRLLAVLKYEVAWREFFGESKELAIDVEVGEAL
jgi:hypothetical protein